MAVETFVNLTVSKRNGVTISPAQKQGIRIDNIRWAWRNVGVTVLVYEETDDGTLERIEVVETPVNIIVAANATGYTENGLAILSVKVWDGTVFDDVTARLMNYQAMTKVTVWNDADLGIVNGAKMFYKSWIDRTPYPVIVTNDLTDTGGGGGS